MERNNLNRKRERSGLKRIKKERCTFWREEGWREYWKRKKVKKKSKAKKKMGKVSEGEENKDGLRKEEGRKESGWKLEREDVGKKVSEFVRKEEEK